MLCPAEGIRRSRTPSCLLAYVARAAYSGRLRLLAEDAQCSGDFNSEPTARWASIGAMSSVMPDYRSFGELMATRSARIGIVGLGYAGLPLGMSFAEAGFTVTGIDLDEERVRAVQARESYLVDVPAERYDSVGDRLVATTDYSAVADLDAITICVPTPLSKTRAPDMTYIVSAAEAIAEYLRPGQLIVLQSTTYPGTTEEVVLPILAQRGGKVGEDFFLGYAPERVDPGNPNYNIRTTPKLVSGVTEQCRRRAALLYEPIVEHVIPLSSTMVAETAKLHENTFRAVNIALANELALMCDRMGISAWEVIDAASSKPFGFLPHFPGPGLGGDCIPVVPHFLASRLREYGYSARLIDAAHEINAHMPVFVLQRIADTLNESERSIKGSRLLLLGLAYKPNVHDTRESPSLEIMRQLLARGADVSYCDPYVESVVLDDVEHHGVSFTPEEVEAADCVVLLTAHRDFVDEPLWDHARLVVDTRNVVPDGPGVHRI
jgi:UDP-N-acetyl-D-glucosamine dehydrogenase